MVKILVPLIFSGIVFFVSCLIIGCVISLFNAMFNFNMPNSKHGNDLERVVPALRF